jgi:UDP-N-acetylglucosamine 2-epimerase (non-hydrolysing)
MSASAARHIILGTQGTRSLKARPNNLEAKKILTIFGTRPEIIKLAPVIQELEKYKSAFETVNVAPRQHEDMLQPFVDLFDIRVDYDLRVMRPGQSVTNTCSRILSRLSSVLGHEKPDLVIVQGDTTSAFAGALSGFYLGIPVAHVEAGLRSRSDLSPFPEEMNRKLITRLATFHFAATPGNRDTLLEEGVVPEKIFVTGNPVVDAMKVVAGRGACGGRLRDLLRATAGTRRIVLTTHRRESLGQVMLQYLKAIRNFIELHEGLTLIFPVHPNPQVVQAANQILANHPRIRLTAPLDYSDFIQLLSESWLIVSDSGGVQEEAPSLGKPLLIIRENTERPEVVEAGVAHLAGGSPSVLSAMLEDAYQPGSWADQVRSVQNPFGRGDAAKQIVSILHRVLSQEKLSASR